MALACPRCHVNLVATGQGERFCEACYEDSMRLINLKEFDVTKSTYEESSPAYTTKDSGLREDFATGARRDVQLDKPRYDLIPVGPLRRLAELYARGAAKYGEHNYQKGIPYRRVYASLFRHLIQWASGDRSEDHLAAVAWNAFALMYYEDKVREGKLPVELNDMKEST